MKYWRRFWESLKDPDNWQAKDPYLEGFRDGYQLGLAHVHKAWEETK